MYKNGEARKNKFCLQNIHTEPLLIYHQILINMDIKYLFHFVCNSINVKSSLCASVTV